MSKQTERAERRATRRRMRKLLRRMHRNNRGTLGYLGVTIKMTLTHADGRAFTTGPGVVRLIDKGEER